MNHRAKFDAVSFILAGEIRNRTNKHTQKQTVNDISTLCLSACVDKNTEQSTCFSIKREIKLARDTVRYDTIRYIYVRSKADDTASVV